jgi:hypothetical protein
MKQVPPQGTKLLKVWKSYHARIKMLIENIKQPNKNRTPAVSRRFSLGLDCPKMPTKISPIE